MVGGYAGKILWVDLTNAKISTLNTADYTDYIGGKGMGLRLQWEFGNPEVTTGTDPRSLLMFMTGPLGGIPSVSGASRMTVSFKEHTQYPKNWFTTSSVGGYFGPELKFAGYDGIVFQGASAKPVYLWIDDGKAVLKDASKYWGKDTYMSQDLIRKELGGDTKIQIGAIGPAGENCCASIILFGTANAAAEHPGGVMGSKKLKAIAVRGSGSVPVAHPDVLLAEQVKFMNLFNIDHKKGWVNAVNMADSASKRPISCFGCSAPSCRAYLFHSDEPRGGNFCGFYGSYQITREIYKGRSKLKRNAFGDGYLTPTLTEIAIADGGMNMEDVSYKFPKLCDLYGLSGMDLLGTRGTPGFLPFLCYDTDLFGTAFRDLVIKEWGDLPGSDMFAENAPKKIASKEGLLGRLFAEGVTLAALRIKQNPADYGLTQEQGQTAWDCMERMFIKNNTNTHHFYYPTTNGGASSWSKICQAPMMQMIYGLGTKDESVHARTAVYTYDHRSKASFKNALAWVGTTDAGGRYLDANGNPVARNQVDSPAANKYYTVDLKEGAPVRINWTKGTPLGVKKVMAFILQSDSLCMCDFRLPLTAGRSEPALLDGDPSSVHNDPVIGNDIDKGARLYSAVTGNTKTFDQLCEISWKCCTLERAVHVRDNGRTITDDGFASFFFDRPDSNGIKIDRTEYRQGLDAYNDLMGFDKNTGNPTRATLEKYGLKDVADKLQALGKLPG